MVQVFDCNLPRVDGNQDAAHSAGGFTAAGGFSVKGDNLRPEGNCGSTEEFLPQSAHRRGNIELAAKRRLSADTTVRYPNELENSEQLLAGESLFLRITHQGVRCHWHHSCLSNVPSANTAGAAFLIIASLEREALSTL